jgi:hypothetical protein
LLVLAALTSFFIALSQLRRKKKQPVFLTRSFTVVKKDSISEFPSIKVLFNDSIVSQVTATKVGLFNSGNLAIRRDDIPSKNRFRIELNNCEVLEYSFLQKSKSLNEMKITDITENGTPTIYFDFDYLDPGDGVIINVLHNGQHDSIQIKGHVIDAGNIKQHHSMDVDFVITNMIVLISVIVAIPVTILFVAFPDKILLRILVMFGSLILAMLLAFKYGKPVANRLRYEIEKEFDV